MAVIKMVSGYIYPIFRPDQVSLSVSGRCRKWDKCSLTPFFVSVPRTWRKWRKCSLTPFLCCALFAAQPQGVDVKIQAQPQSATVGDPIQFDLDITCPLGYQVTVPNPGKQIGEFEVLQFLPGPSLPDAGRGLSQQSGPNPGPFHHKARIVAAVYKTGEFEFPPVRVQLQTADGQNLEISSQPVKVRIESVLSPKDQDLKGLKRQAEIAEPIRWILWFALGTLIVILAAIAWWLLRRRRRPSAALPSRPQVNPLELAEAELRDLVSRGLLEKGLVKAFYVTLSEIVKRAVEAAYVIPTLEKTTSEIMEGLRSNPASPGSAILERIESLLLCCDLVKFAKYLPSPAESQVTVRSAFEILSDCKAWRTAAAAEAAPVAEPT